MQMQTFSKWVVITGALLIYAVKFIVRPYVHVPAGMQLFVDVAPNFIGTFLVPFFACWLLKNFLPVENTRQLKFVCVLGLFLGVINEYLQLIPVFGRTFDYLDILASGVSAICSYNCFALVLRRKMLFRKQPQLV